MPIMPDANVSDSIDCFGLNNRSAICKTCPVHLECKFFIADTGIDAIADIFEIMLYQLPEGWYEDTNKESIKASYVTGQIGPSNIPVDKRTGTTNIGDEDINPMDPDLMASKVDKFQNVINRIQENQKKG